MLVLDYVTFLIRLPDYACKFLEICLMVSADHGPAVSGAHNTIVTARAGKDLVSSLTSGLLTIVSTFVTDTPLIAIIDNRGTGLVEPLTEQPNSFRRHMIRV